MEVGPSDCIELHVWRCVDEPRGPGLGGRVWYEWALTQPVRTPILNPNGRSYAIGM